MIRYLSVRNLAIVERIDVELGAGLTVLTGETGAGKSIVLGALDLLVGGRATAELVRSGEDKAVVQAVLDADDGREVVLRREVSAQGRSRVFIDDELTTVGALQTLGRQLVDFHGQHRQQTLLDQRTHLPLLDLHGGLAEQASAVAAAHGAWRAAESRLTQARRRVADRAERVELLTFQSREIDDVAPLPGEDEELAAARTRLANTERLITLCSDAYGALYEQDAAVLAKARPRVATSGGAVGTSIRCSSSTSPAGTPSGRNSRTSRSSCDRTRRASTGRRSGWPRSSPGWRSWNG